MSKDWAQIFDDINEFDDQLNSEDHYSVFEEIGSGGAKKVFRAVDNHSGREVAYIRPANDQLEELFLREARITSYLQHPNIIPVYEVSAESEPYFVCKLLRGGSLQEKVADLSGERSLMILFKKICQAMEYAHSRGVLHMDLKPENIHLDKFGEALIIDWGLAEIICTDDVESPLDNPLIATRESISSLPYGIGTPGFMSPEQIRAASPSVRSDVFSLGALLYFMFKRSAPFEGDSLDDVASKTLTQAREELVIDSVSSGVQAIIRKCLSIEPGDRYSSVKGLIQDVDAYLCDYVPQAENARLIHHLRMLYRRNKRFCQLTALFLIMMGVGLYLHVKQLTESRLMALEARDNAEQEKERAEKYLAEVLEKDENNRKLSVALAPRYVQAAEEAWEYFNFKAAEEYCRLAMHLDPDNLDAKSLFGKILFSKGEFTKAVPLISESSSSHSVKVLLKDLSQSSQPLKDILKNNQDNHQVRVLKSRYLMRQYLEKQNLNLLREVIVLLDQKVATVNVSLDNGLVNLAKNKELHLVNFIGALPEAKINLSHTKITNLEVFRHREISELNVSYTPLWNLSPLENKEIQKLNVSHCYVSSIWPLENSKIIELDVSKNKLEQIPNQLMRNLKFLNISRTRVRKIPNVQASHLEVLICGQSPLMISERDLANLPNLKELHFSEGQISDEVRSLLEAKGVKLVQSSSF